MQQYEIPVIDNQKDYDVWAKKAVKRGAKYLDKNVPNWFEAIDLSTLDLGDCSLCVCGQLARSSAIVVDKINKYYKEKATKNNWYDQYSDEVDEASFDYNDMIDVVYKEKKKSILKNKGIEFVDSSDIGIYYGFCIPEINDSNYIEYNESLERHAWQELDRLWQNEVKERLSVNA